MTTRDDIKQAALSLIPWPEGDHPGGGHFDEHTKAITAKGLGTFAHECGHKVYDASPVRLNPLWHSPVLEETFCELNRANTDVGDEWETHFWAWVRSRKDTAAMRKKKLSRPQRIAVLIARAGIDDQTRLRALWHDWCEKAAQRPDNAAVQGPRHGGSD